MPVTEFQTFFMWPGAAGKLAEFAREDPAVSRPMIVIVNEPEAELIVTRGDKAKRISLYEGMP